MIICALSLLLSIINVQAVAQSNGNGDPSIERIEITYEVMTLGVVNAASSEFSPFVANGKLYFTSDRESNMVTYGESNWKQMSYLSLFEADIQSINDSIALKKVKPLSFAINGSNHTGPMCFSKDGSTAYFTRVEPPKKQKGNKVIAKPKLFMAKVVDGKFKDVELLPFCTEDVSYGHPALSADGQTLYFAADLAGGQGGKDIFMVKREGDGWSAPKNLGDRVNSSGDEMFPTVYQGTLYFSSNGRTGQGGLDLFKIALSDDNQQAAENLGATINSSADDFGLVLTNNGEYGYFASNRENGAGGDDIYRVKVIETVIVKTRDLAGQFRYRTLGKDYPEGMKVMLVDDEGNIIATTFTDGQGQFNFDKLPYDADYTIQLENIGEDVELIIFGKNGEPEGFLLANKEGEFVYKRLPYDAAGTMALIDETDIDLSANTGTLSGQFVYEELAADYPEGMKVYLVDDEGNIIYTTTTDRFGNFTFENIPLDNNYTIKTEENLKDYTLLVYNRNGDVVAELKGNGQGEFVYRRLASDEVSPMLLVDAEDGGIDFMGNFTSVFGQFKYEALGTDHSDGLTVLVLDEDGNLIAQSQTDKEGYFRFTSLPLDGNFKFKLKDAEDSENIILTIYDRKGEVVGYLKSNEEGYFYYHELSKDNPELMQTTDVNDVDVLAMINNEELPKIYYEKNSSYIDEISAEKLRQIAQIMNDNPDLKLELGSHTDARASDDYNMELSERRTKGVIAYLKRKGIDPSRITGKWYGETVLVNDCENGVECPEDKHRENRRTEFKFY